MKKLALVNGKIYVNKHHFVSCLLIQDNKIEALLEDINSLDLSGIETIDLKGKTVIPGFNDSHLHMILKGMEMLEVKTSDVDSVESLIDICKKYMKEHPERCKYGLVSTGWNQDKFESGEKRMPNRHDLDKISTDVPIILYRVCAHIVSVNTKVIELLGLGKNPTQPDNGTILLEEDGYPSGIFTENYAESIRELVPPATLDDLRGAFLEAQKYALSRGITSIQSNDVGMCGQSMENVFGLIRDIYESGEGKIRYRHQICVHDINELKDYLSGEYKKEYVNPNLLDKGPLKLFKDGSLGGRTALLRNEYRDDPGNFGVETISDKDFDDICKLASDNGMQIVTHTIGDAAVEKVVNSYEKIAKGENNLRNGIVHCQITDKPLMNRIAENNLLVLYQPIFLDYDIHIVEDRCGKKLASTSYAFKTANDLGISVSFGTDSPVEDPDPFSNLYCAVTRKDKKGYPKGGFTPSECMDICDAIDNYTVGSAYCEFKENIKGRLLPGYLADLVVLDSDIFTCEPEKIKDINPILTIVGGEIVFKKI